MHNDDCSGRNILFVVFLAARACIVAIKEYRDGLRHELTLPLLSVTTGHLKVAITLEHNNQGNQTFEEPRSSGAGSQVPMIWILLNELSMRGKVLILQEIGQRYACNLAP